MQCLGNNSFINEDGKCACKSEFPYGDPYTKKGCWNCIPMCDDNFVCSGPNICQCIPGFYQFGLKNKSCRVPIPELISSNPKRGFTSGGTEVFLEIKSPPGHNISQAFCRFGPISVKAKISNDSNLICVSPVNRKGKVILDASFDSSRWSENHLTFEYINNQFGLYNCVLLCIMIIVISAILFLIAWFFRSQNGTFARSEEMLPLNKWHIIQEQEFITEEKGFLDFVKNIALN